MEIPHPIPYQGSKRNIAEHILKLYPSHVDTLIEPFSGSAAVSIATAYKNMANRFIINDINQPLANLLEEIIKNPQKIADAYEKLWHEQTGNEKEYYKFIRDKFNKTKQPEYLLYLLARCVKAAIRYNTIGEFNQSPDNRRKGRNPVTMRADINGVSKLLKGKTTVFNIDYKEILKNVKKGDLIYMDPPYQGVCGNRDSRYYEKVDFEEFILELEKLVDNDIQFILSYDGRKGEKAYGKNIPQKLGLYHIEVNAGRSSQSTLLGGNDVTYESLYISPELIQNLDILKYNRMKKMQVRQKQALLSI